MIAAFMGTTGAAAPPTNQGASGATGVEDNIPNNVAGQKKRQLLGGLLGGGGNGGGAGATGITGLLGGGGQKATGPPETSVALAAGQGAVSGLPTANADGTVDMTFRQVSALIVGVVTMSLLFRRSTRTVLALSRLLLTAPRAEPILQLSRTLRSQRMSQDLVSRVFP